MEGKVYNDDPEELKKCMSQFDASSEVAVKASRNWYWFADMLQEKVIKVYISNPKQIKAIAWARLKNDKVDARMPCHLLKADLLPTCPYGPCRLDI